MVTYEQWNRAIISYFFEDCEPGEIVFLQTNAETLDEIAERSNFNISDAADSLKMAVRNKAVVSGAINFWAMNPTLWGDYSQEKPPQVTFLALTVFAASLMESEGSVAATNFHTRLNELLFGRIIKGAPQGFNHGEFENFWKHLQKWAKDQHNVVLYLTEGSTNRRYVWYPISQCLISRHDRRDIYRFFRKHNLTPFSQISDDQLEKKLLGWVNFSGLTKIKRYFSNASYRKSICSQVKSLLKHWNDEIPPEPSQGERQTTASVNVEIRFDPFDNASEIRYWFPTRGREKIKCKANHLEIQCLQPSHLEKWFRPIPDDRGEFWDWNLLNCLQLQTDEPNPIIYTLGLSDIWVFREDAERGNSWFSQRNMHQYEDHLILFRKGLVKEVMDCLRQTCEEELEQPSPVRFNEKENGWFYLRAEPTKLVYFSKQRLWRLSVDSEERIRFVGGLSAKDRNGRRAYLDICLPTVFIPKLGLPDQEPLRINDREFPLNEERFFTLDNKFEPGVYQLTYGRQSRELRIISPDNSLEHHNQRLIASISKNRTSIPTYTKKEISDVLNASGIWLTGAKLTGDILSPSPPTDDELLKVPANIVSSVVKIAIDLKEKKILVPEWFEEAIEYLDKNTAIRALVEKKLNTYNEAALSYTELRKHIGK